MAEDSMWTHAICESCWNERAAELAEPVKTPHRVPDCREVCCYCGNLTTDGIFVGAHGITLRCKGSHPIVEPKTGIHIISINSSGIMTKDYETGNPVAMWIVTLSSGDIAFLALEKSALTAIGTDLITVETMLEGLANKFCTPADATAVSRVLHAHYQPPSLSATEARQRLEHQIAMSRQVADARRAERGDQEPSATGDQAPADTGGDGYAQ